MNITIVGSLRIFQHKHTNYKINIFANESVQEQFVFRSLGYVGEQVGRPRWAFGEYGSPRSSLRIISRCVQAFSSLFVVCKANAGPTHRGHRKEKKDQH